MVKVKALQEFTYGDFNKIINLVRNDKEKNQQGKLYEKDTFECTENMAKYLTGGCGYVLVKVIEVIPEEVIEDGTIEHPYTTVMPQPIEETKEEAKPKKTRKAKKK